MSRLCRICLVKTWFSFNVEFLPKNPYSVVGIKIDFVEGGN